MKDKLKAQLESIKNGIINIPELERALTAVIEQMDSESSDCKMRDLLSGYESTGVAMRLLNHLRYMNWDLLTPSAFIKLTTKKAFKDSSRNIGSKSIDYLDDILKKHGYNWK